tara:strand:+ start:1792 stop:2742 length:951 start_codon:yes stop_codon:yes gene_type:complete
MLYVTIDGAFNMDSENMSEVENEIEQPVTAVAADAEVKLDEPQSSDDEVELFIEEEGEQTDTPKKDGMTDEQAKAAFRQEREKRKAKAKQNDELQRKLDEQAKELAELKASVSQVTKGPKPSILDFSSDDDYHAAMNKWNGVEVTEQAQAPAANAASIDLSEDQAWHLHKNEEEIKKSFSDYDDVKVKAEEAFKSAGIDNTGLAMKQIAAVCHEDDINTGKVNYALGKFPSFAKDLLEASNKNPAAVRTVLRKLEGKVQARTRKKVNSEPEPKLKSNGAVNVGSEAEKKAMKDYVESGHSIEKYKALQKIRKANKA